MEKRRSRAPRDNDLSTLGGVVGNRIRTIRVRRGILQAELAKRVGVTQKTISIWENGEQVPSLENVYQVAAALGTTAHKILPPSAP
jgi:transcriptional regulator with XRE-family HTH domain